jgi:hypothetical protein
MAPNFLLGPMGCTNFMRLSLKKGAHADSSRAACRKFGVFAKAYMGRRRRGEAPSKVCLYSASATERVTAGRPSVPATQDRVPHISLVFREMWDATVFQAQLCSLYEKRRGPATTLDKTATLSFVIPSEAEGPAVPRTIRGSAEHDPQPELSSRPERSAVERPAVRNPSWVPPDFVSGHDLSRAVKASNNEGLSPCGNPVLSEGYGLQAVHNCCVMKSALAAEGCNSFAITLYAQILTLPTPTFVRKVN